MDMNECLAIRELRVCFGLVEVRPLPLLARTHACDINVGVDTFPRLEDVASV